VRPYRTSIRAPSASTGNREEPTVLVIQQERMYLRSFERLQQQGALPALVGTTDATQLLSYIVQYSIDLLMVSFHAYPIEGPLIYQLFRVLCPDTPAIVLFDESYWSAELAYAQDIGFNAALVGPITLTKWQQAARYLQGNPTEFCLIQ